MKYIFVVLTFVSGLCFAQNKGSIKGRTVEMSTQKGVEFASVALLSSSDSSLVKGGVTDTLGRFMLQNIADGHYLLAISSVEYQRFVSAPIHINENQRDWDVGTLFLQADQKQLNEVVVKGIKPVFEQKMGNIIVNVDSKMFKTATNALEVMRRSPGLLVDMSGKITFRGTSPKILIDGKDLRMTEEQEKNYLKSLTPDQIETIELMPTPPAKYESSFQTVINIKLKRDQNLGGRGSIYGTYLQHRFATGDAGGNLSYKTRKMAFSLNTGWSASNWYQELTDRRIMGKEGNKDVFESYAYLKNPNQSLNGLVGVEYVVSPRHSFDFKLTGDMGKAPSSTYAENKSVLRGNEQPLMISYNQMTENSRSLTGLAGYTYKNNKGRELMLEVAVAGSQKPGTQNMVSEYVRNNEQVRGISVQRNDQLANSTFRTLNAIYTDVVGKEWKLEAGFKMNYVKNLAKIDYDTLIRTDASRSTPLTVADFRKDFGRSNEFTFDENITMFFMQMSKQFKKLGFTAGLRAENTVTQGESVTLGAIVNRNYWNILPNLTLQYKLNDNSNLVWSSSRKISRPTVWQLNPFPFFIDPYTVAMGNPFLYPRIRNVSEVTYSYKKLMLVTGYNYNQNGVTQLPLYNATTRLTTWQQVNANNQRLFFDVSHSATLMPKWNYQMYLSTAYGGENVTLNGQSNSVAGLSASLWVSNIFTLPKGYTLEVSGWYNVPDRASFYRARSLGAINLGIQKSFANNRWNTQLNVNDIFWTSIFRANIQVDDSDMTFTNVQPQRYASFRVTYNFGKSKYQARGRKSGVSEDAARIRK